MVKLQNNISHTGRKYGKKAVTLLSSKKGQAYTYLILSFFTMAFFGYFAIKPTLTTIAKLYKQIEDRRQVDKKLTEKIVSLIKAKEDYDLISGALPALNTALPSSPDIIQMLSTIELNSTTAQATISSFTMQEVVLSTQSSTLANSKLEPISIPFSISISGSYEKIQRFIHQLVSNPRIIKIESLNISPSDQEGIVTISVSAEAEGFYYQQPQTLKTNVAPAKAGAEYNNPENIGN